MKTSLLFLLLAVVATGASSCLEAGAKDRCRTTADCFAGRSCTDGRCMDDASADGGTICENNCAYEMDGVCDDGSDAASTDLCDLGTDCSDCSNPQQQRQCSAICPEDDTGCNEDVCMARSSRLFDIYRCSAAAPCPASQRCQFGYCMETCEDRSDCFPSFCVDDTRKFCAPEGDMSCSLQESCEEGHTCRDGVCILPAATSCEIDGDCDFWSLCLDVRGERICSEVPYCDDALACDTGTAGALCNAGLVVDKGPICLQGHCLSSDDCAETHDCLQPLDATGRCSDHSAGAFCVEASDCSNGDCVRAVAELPFGRCQ